MFVSLIKNKLKITLITLVLGLLALPIFHFVQTNYYLMPLIESNQKNVSAHYPKILSDLKLVSENLPFTASTYDKNAEAFISQHVSWQGKDFTPLASSDHVALNELFAKYPKWKSDEKQFEALYHDPLLMQINAKWVEELDQFTNWDFSTYSSVADELKRVPSAGGIARIGIFAALPIPSYSEYRNWATVYALQKSRKGESVEGLKTFRMMAQLANSTGILIGNMIAVAMLKDEHVLTKSLKINNWQLVSEDTIDAYKRVSWGWVGIVRTTWFYPFPQEFEQYLKPENGVCAAAWENSGGLSVFSDFLEDRIFFEKDFSKNFEYSRDFQKKLFSMCNMKKYEGFASRTPAAAQPLIGRGYNNYLVVDAEQANNSISLNWGRIPFVRQLIGLNLIAVSVADYMKLYQDKPK